METGLAVIRLGDKVPCAKCGRDAHWAKCLTCDDKFIAHTSLLCDDADIMHYHHRVIHEEPGSRQQPWTPGLTITDAIRNGWHES